MPQLISLPSPLCRTARRLSNLLWWKLDGSLSKQFASGIMDFSLTLGAAKLSIPLADQCVFLQTVTAECMQAGYCLGIGKTIQTDCTSNLFFEVYQQRFHCERWINSGTPFLVLWDSGKLEPFIASQNILHNTHRQPTRFEIIYPLTLEAEVKEGFSRIV